MGMIYYTSCRVRQDWKVLKSSWERKRKQSLKMRLPEKQLRAASSNFKKIEKRMKKEEISC